MVNLNKSTFEELQTLEGIGEKRAQTIIDNRPYKDVYELSSVKGFGKKIIDAVINSITI